MTAAELAAHLAVTPGEEQGRVLRAALAVQWQPQLAAHLDYWAREGLARRRAARYRQIATTSLYAATVWIAPVWPGDAARVNAIPARAAPLTPPETAFRRELASYWEAQLAARLDFWTTDTLAKVRAASDLAQVVAALTPLWVAGVDIEVE